MIKWDEGLAVHLHVANDSTSITRHRIAWKGFRMGSRPFVSSVAQNASSNSHRSNFLVFIRFINFQNFSCDLVFVVESFPHIREPSILYRVIPFSGMSVSLHAKVVLGTSNPELLVFCYSGNPANLGKTQETVVWWSRWALVSCRVCISPKPWASRSKRKRTL